MLTLAATKRFWVCFSCALLHLQCPPPTIFSGRRVPFSHCLLCWGGGSTGKTLWCILGWKRLSSVSEFLEKTLHCGSFFFFFFKRPVFYWWNTFLMLTHNTVSWAERGLQPPPLLTVWCMNLLPSTLTPLLEKSAAKKSIRAKLYWLLPGQHRMSLGWMAM